MRTERWNAMGRVGVVGVGWDGTVGWDSVDRMT